jgi:hypothetical protein
MPKVKVEGKTLELPEDVCRTNQEVINALVTFYPGVANADIKREGKGDDMVITVTKKAGKKGSLAPVIQALHDAPETISPLIVIGASGAQPNTQELDDAILKMLEEEKAAVRVVLNLVTSEAQPAPLLPKGF